MATRFLILSHRVLRGRGFQVTGSCIARLEGFAFNLAEMYGNELGNNTMIEYISDRLLCGNGQISSCIGE